MSAADIHAVTRKGPIYPSPVNLAEIRFGIDLMAEAKCRAMATLRRTLFPEAFKRSDCAVTRAKREHRPLHRLTHVKNPQHRPR